MLLVWIRLRRLGGVLLIGIKFVVFRWKLGIISTTTGSIIIKYTNRNLIALIKSLWIIWIFRTTMTIKKQKESIWIPTIIINRHYIKKITSIKQIAETTYINLTKTHKKDTTSPLPHNIKIPKIKEIPISITISHNFTHS